MRRGSDISDFLVPSRCSRTPDPTPNPEEPADDFQPDPIFEKEPRVPFPSLRMTTDTGHGDSARPIISARNRLRAETGYCRTKKNIHDPLEASGTFFLKTKWTVDTYANAALLKSPACTSGKGFHE